MWQCPNCQKSNQGNFCTGCQTPKPESDPHPVADYTYQSPTVKKVSRALISAGIVFSVILVVGMAFVLGMIVMSNNGNDSENDKSKTDSGYEEQVKDKEADADNIKEHPAAEEVPDADETIPKESENSKVMREEPQEPTPDTQGKSAPTRTDSKPVEDNKPEKKAETPQKVTYSTYTNDSYGFYCDYPDHFNSTSPKGVNAIKRYVSDDGTAVMTIRAAENSSSITTGEALNEFLQAYKGKVNYKRSGDEWYAASVTTGGKIIYRKLLNKNGNLCCVDFEMNAGDEDKYSSYIEHIENNFDAY